MKSNCCPFLFFDTLVKVPAGIADIICIRRITLKLTNDALLVHHGRFLFFHHDVICDLTAGINRTDLGVYFLAQITKLILSAYTEWSPVSNSRILGLIWRGTAYFVQNDTCILPGDSDWRVRCRTRSTHFMNQIKSFETQNISSNLFLLSDMDFGVTNPFSWIFNAAMYLTLGQYSFSNLLNPDWSIQISGD